MRFVWSDLAFAELQAAIADAEVQSPAWADAILAEIERAETLLARHPRAGQMIEGSDRRKLRLGSLPFILVYRLRDAHIDVARFHHARADWRG